MSQPGWLGSLRVAALYMAGVILGCLGATCVEPNKYLLGASAGVYALILAHLGYFKFYNTIFYQSNLLFINSAKIRSLIKFITLWTIYDVKGKDLLE
jgi:hypothetical protein